MIYYLILFTFIQILLFIFFKKNNLYILNIFFTYIHLIGCFIYMFSNFNIIELDKYDIKIIVENYKKISKLESYFILLLNMILNSCLIIKVLYV